jgi:hydrogenase expression/formation protein HypC
MCIGRPARVIDVTTPAGGLPEGHVDVAGTAAPVSFAYLPDVTPGEWVVVHAGFAVTRVAEDEAIAAVALVDDLERSPGRTTTGS